MSEELSLSEQLAFCTVRIECELASGQLGTGTGFFFKFADTGDQHVPVIVTNKHVVRGAKKGIFYMTLATTEGMPNFHCHHPFAFDNFEGMWTPHPDKNIDLCFMYLAPLVNAANMNNTKFFYIGLDKALIPTKEELDDMPLMEDIVMVGYPNGIWDQVNNMPVFRRGITATHPNIDWNGKSEFLIDAACFPGSSGSPVFLYNVGGHTTKSKGLVIGPGRLKLLGILYAGHQQTVTGEIKEVEVPTQNIPQALSNIPINLGIVIKATKLEDFDVLLRNNLQTSKKSG